MLEGRAVCISLLLGLQGALWRHVISRSSCCSHQMIYQQTNTQYCQLQRAVGESNVILQ